MHEWKAGDLAKCVEPFPYVPVRTPQVGQQLFVIDVQMSEWCPEHQKHHTFLVLPGFEGGWEAECFVPVVPDFEEPKVRVKEDA